MIPNEIDELMWTIAEGGDGHAVTEFGERYPALREELLKRIRTVQALKAAGRPVSSGKIPAFRNTQTRPVNARPVFLSLGLAAVLAFAFGIWKVSAKSETVKPQVAPINVENPKIPQPVMIPNGTNQSEITPQPSHRAPIEPPINPPVITHQNPNGGSAKTDIELESASLHAAITLIAEAGHLKVTIAPGLADPTIKVDMHNKTPVEMLKELGNTYAFEVLLDGDHSIMVIPKKDDLDDQMTNETR